MHLKEVENGPLGRFIQFDWDKRLQLSYVTVSAAQATLYPPELYSFQGMLSFRLQILELLFLA